MSIDKCIVKFLEIYGIRNILYFTLEIDSELFLDDIEFKEFANKLS